MGKGYANKTSDSNTATKIAYLSIDWEDIRKRERERQDKQRLDAWKKRNEKKAERTSAEYSMQSDLISAMIYDSKLAKQRQSGRKLTAKERAQFEAQREAFDILFTGHNNKRIRGEKK